jgi:hypothetical protein
MLLVPGDGNVGNPFHLYVTYCTRRLHCIHFQCELQILCVVYQYHRLKAMIVGYVVVHGSVTDII